jgi:hypothetical protein
MKKRDGVTAQHVMSCRAPAFRLVLDWDRSFAFLFHLSTLATRDVLVEAGQSRDTGVQDFYQL